MTRLPDGFKTRRDIHLVWWGPVLDSPWMTERILNRLRHVRNPATTAQLHRTTGTGYTRDGFRKLLTRMEAAGLIIRTEPARRGRAVWWTLP
jgi:hypothetical protein